MVTEWILLALSVILVLATGVFVAAEFSLVTVDRGEVEAASRDGDARAEGVLVGLKTLSTQLSGAQVGITITTLLVGFLMEPSLSRLLQTPLMDAGVRQDLIPAVSLGLAMFIATALSMVLGELIPKNLALSLPMATAKWSVPLQRAFTFATGPLIRVLNGTANQLLHRVGLEPAEELSGGRSPEELVAMVRRSAEVGTLDEGTAELVTRSISFAAHTAVDAMTPRGRLETVERHNTAIDIIELSRQTGLSRFPVTGENLDDIIGVVHVKKAVAVPHTKRAEVPAGALMTEPLTVPETLRLDRLLTQLKDHGSQLAVLEDEYGGTAGVITIEDLIEEIVGEVSDEHDRPLAGLYRTKDGSIMFSGLLRPDEFTEVTGVHIPESRAYETIGGFMMTTVGNVGSVGMTLPVSEGHLTVVRMEGMRIARVRFTPQHRKPLASTPHTQETS